MSTQYFSDRETGPKPRTSEEISPRIWGGIVASISTRIQDGSFGSRFPSTCPDGDGVSGCSEHDFRLAFEADIPSVSWPFDPGSVPPTLAVLDLIEFCFQSTGKPIQQRYHDYFSHYHLVFDREKGKESFRSDINRIFARNGIAFELSESGSIERIAPEGVRDLMKSARFLTGDNDLDLLLDTARAKYLNPDLIVRKESLEKLWDAWERLKTVESADKKTGVATLLSKAAAGAEFRTLLDKEARELTDIGNNFRIRHSETSKTPIEVSEHVDYLFHRMFSIAYLLLKKSGRAG